MSVPAVKTGECIGNFVLATNQHGTCPTAVLANTFSSEATFLDGPVPAGGGTVTNLEATVEVVPGTGSYTVAVFDNTTNTSLLSCSIAVGTTFCQNTSSTPVLAGHYLEVKVTLVGGAPNAAFRVTFRY